MTRFEEMDARGMFDELGYKRYENHPEGDKNAGGFTTQDTAYIQYTNENDQALESISFDLWSKNIWFTGYRKDLKHQVPCPINMKELQAINRQIEELGWIK